MQQNNMNQSNVPLSPTYQHQQMFTKNNRLYQQLLHSDYLNDHIYQQSSGVHTQAAHIKFTSLPPNLVKMPKNVQNSQQPAQYRTKTQKPANLFKSFEPQSNKLNHQITQSLSSNYCITQNQNEENSTVNLYSLSHNHIDQDLSISSNNITAKIIAEAQPFCQLGEESSSHKSNIILNQSILNNDSDKLENVICLSEQDKFKKYRSQEYSHFERDLNREEKEEEGKVPKLLAGKYIKNQISKKFSMTQNNSVNGTQANFKTILNQIHIVPYKITQQIKPYAFSIPLQKPISSNEDTANSPKQTKRYTKTHSLNLHYSNHSEQDRQQASTIVAKNLYFSNHTHLNNFKGQAHFNYHNQSNSQALKQQRTAPKSQPKNCVRNQKNLRSNSIQCKSKPLISLKHVQQPGNQQPNDKLDQSQVTKLFKNSYNPQQQFIAHQSSVIYESNTISLCCGLNRSIQEQPQINKINFLPHPKDKSKNEPSIKQAEKNSPFFCSSIDMTNLGSLQNPKGIYKINPIQVIKEHRQVAEDEKCRKGIKLIGYPSKKE